MKIVVVYVYPKGWDDKAVRFVHSYHAHPPGEEHDTVVVCNNGIADNETRFMFETLPNLNLLEHDNSGQDIGAFQVVAQTVPADLMVFFGAHAYFRRANWLPRVRSIFELHGSHLYGATGSQGIGHVWPHVRTTGFWCHPEIMNMYPIRVTQASQRYEFEHGASGITTWITNTLKRRAYVVGWEGEADIFTCNSLPGGFQQGNQSNVLFGDRMTCPPYYPYE